MATEEESGNTRGPWPFADLQKQHLKHTPDLSSEVFLFASAVFGCVIGIHAHVCLRAAGEGDGGWWVSIGVCFHCNI